jgi:hypothetical protein
LRRLQTSLVYEHVAKSVVEAFSDEAD